jgi:hypothetical protein
MFPAINNGLIVRREVFSRYHMLCVLCSVPNFTLILKRPDTFGRFRQMH